MSSTHNWLRVMIGSLSCLCIGYIRAEEPVQTPVMRVTIVAVSKFDDTNLSNDTELTTAIETNAQALKKYFEDHFSIVPELFNTKDETSDSGLRDWLFDDLRADSEKSIHLIFVLTHGFPNPGTDKKVNDSDIYLATSNTYESKPASHAIRGMELLEAIGHTAKRNTYFLFIDSCGSGAINGDMLQNTLRYNPDLASRLMILTAAMPDEKAYRARFTEALLRIWQANNSLCSQANLSACHCGSSIESYLTNQIKTIPGVSPDVAQNVQLVSEYFPDFCIELFGIEQRVLFLFNGAAGETEVTLQAADRDIAPMSMRTDATRVVNLNSDNYTLIAKRVHDPRDDSHVVIPINLKSKPADVEILFSNQKEIDNAVTGQTAALYLQSREVAPEFTDGLLKTSDANIHTMEEMYQVEKGRAATDLEHFVTAQGAASADVSAAVARLDDAQRRVAETTCTSCMVALPDTPESVAARKAVQSATEDYQQKQAAKNQIDRSIAAIRVVLENSQRMNDLYMRTVEIEANPAQKSKAFRLLVQDAKKQWSNVAADERGIEFKFPKSRLLPQKELAQLTEFIRDEGSKTALQMEVEVPTNQSELRKKNGDEAALQIARSVKAQLRASVPASIPIAARAYVVPPQMKSDTLRVVLSLHWPSDFNSGLTKEE
jgi:hypothetical protein